MYLMWKRLHREPLINVEVTISMILIPLGVSRDISSENDTSTKEGDWFLGNLPLSIIGSLMFMTSDKSFSIGGILRIPQEL